jgi:hypothetical protein
MRIQSASRGQERIPGRHAERDELLRGGLRARLRVFQPLR